MTEIKESTIFNHFGCPTSGFYAIPPPPLILKGFLLTGERTRFFKWRSNPLKDNHNIATNDNCPDWAAELISKIFILEVEAGTIKSPGDKSTDSNWATTEIDKLVSVASRLDLTQGDTSAEISSTVEGLFVKIVQGLHREGHSAVVIANMINARIPTGCRLPYCDASEVVGALSDGS